MQSVQFGQLVVGQRLGGEEVEGAGGGVGQQRLGHRQVVAQGLAAGGGGGDHQVFAGLRGAPGRDLVAVERIDAAVAQRSGQLRLQISRQRQRMRRSGRHLLPAGDMAHEACVAAQGVKGGFDGHGWDREWWEGGAGMGGRNS
ncbi:MAG: hypothetical protein V9H69_09940 [Anaerolineae bacterium]